MRRSLAIDWGRTRVRALRARRRVWQGRRVRCDGSGAARLEAFEALDPGRGEILVRVDLSAVSPGTERAQYNRLPGVVVGPVFTPGYSGVGRVLRAGRDAGFRPGDRVAGPFHHQSIETLAAARCHRVPDDVEDVTAAMVGLGIIALHGVRRAALVWGERVVVLGRGLLGRLTAALAALAGAGEVRLVGRADAVPARGFDVAFDVTGNPEALERAAAAVHAQGRVILVGSPRGIAPPFGTGSAGAVEIRGVHATLAGRTLGGAPTRTPQEEGELFLELCASKRLRPELTEAETILPDECWAFYRRLGSGRPPVHLALFDWRTLSDDDRARRSTLRPPDALERPGPDEQARRRRAGAPLKARGW